MAFAGSIQIPNTATASHLSIRREVYTAMANDDSESSGTGATSADRDDQGGIIDITIADAANPDSNRPTSSTWTCRLPPELTSSVLEYLVDDEALGTLASFQSTSRATYTIATPHLYRHLVLDQRQVIDLFGLFETFPRSDNHLFCQPIPSQYAHLLDLHICHRLRYFLSNTRTLSLEFRPILSLDCFDRARTTRYRELVNGLKAFEESTLWPLLEKCVFAMEQLPSRTRMPDPTTANLEAEEQAPILDDVMACIHPKHLRIIFPDPPAPRMDSFASSPWASYHQKLRADHVELCNFSRGHGIPLASTSLSIHFGDSNWFNSIYDTSRLDTSLEALFHDIDSFSEIQDLKLVGMYGPSDVNRLGRSMSSAEAMDYAASQLEDLMELRRYAGNRDDLRITVQLDTTPEGEAGATSRVFMQPPEEEVLPISNQAAGSNETGQWDVWHKMNEQSGDHILIFNSDADTNDEGMTKERTMDWIWRMEVEVRLRSSSGWYAGDGGGPGLPILMFFHDNNYATSAGNGLDDYAAILPSVWN